MVAAPTPQSKLAAAQRLTPIQRADHRHEHSLPFEELACSRLAEDLMSVKYRLHAFRRCVPPRGVESLAKPRLRDIGESNKRLPSGKLDAISRNSSVLLELVLPQRAQRTRKKDISP